MIPARALWFAAVSALLGALALVLSGCGHGYDGVRQGMTASAKIVGSAAEAFGDFDLAHQEGLIKDKPKADAAAAVAAWRAARVPIVKGFADAGAVIALAIATINAAEQGAKSGGDVAAITVQVFTVLQELWKALKDAGVKLPSAPSSSRAHRFRTFIADADPVPDICDPTLRDGAAACRPFVTTDNFPLEVR